MHFERLLCPIDFSDFSVSAYEYALTIADYYKAHLMVLHAIETWKYPYADYAGSSGDFADFSNALCEGGSAKLKEFVKKHCRPGIEPQLVVDQGNPSDLILSFVQSYNIEVIVMGTHGRRGFDRLMLGSTTDRVIRKASCPVLVVSNPSHNEMTTTPEGQHRLSRILYCTDFSVNSERALQYAISVAAEYGAELTLLHVVEEKSSGRRAEAVLAMCREQLDKIVPGPEGRNFNVRCEVKVGKAYEEIVRYAKETKTSLITMTARGGDALDRAVFGSTTYRVIQLGPCPVLAVHT
jgi:nucleotide-binding universal stress UspA family protein